MFLDFVTVRNEWYPRGIQISLHIRSPGFQAWGGGYSGVNFGDLKPKVFHFRGRGRGVFRSKLWSSQIWSFSLGGGAFWSEIPERGFLENLDKNLLFSQKPACASQIVSHILRIWRLNDKIVWELFLYKKHRMPRDHLTLHSWYHEADPGLHDLLSVNLLKTQCKIFKRIQTCSAVTPSRLQLKGFQFMIHYALIYNPLGFLKI